MILGVVRRILKEDLARSGELPVWLDALLSPLNDFLDKMSSAMRNNLTFKDNFSGTQVSISLTHNVAQTINPGTNTKIIGVLLFSAQSQMVTGFQWSLTQNNQISVTVQFSAGGTSQATCLFQLLTG